MTWLDNFDLTWLRPVVWTDFRLAVLLTVILPLVLLIWAFVKKADAIQHILVIYWRVASLLGITVYLMIGGLQIGFVAAAIARALIPLSLWFWIDLNDEVEDYPDSPLKLGFTAWRWAVSLYNGLGLLIILAFMPCGFSRGLVDQPACQVWFDPPLKFREYFHAGTPTASLGFIGIMALTVYMFCLAYFVFFRLGKQGRSALNQ